MNIEIAPARAEDRAAILELIACAGLPVDGLADHFNTMLVARDEGRVVGSAGLELYLRGALLRSVAVDARLRGSGLGRRLTEAAIALASESRVPVIYLLTTTAERFFPKFGFERITRADVSDDVLGSVEFKSVCPTSAVVMRKILADTL